MKRQIYFKGWFLPVVLITPQLVISAIFFFYPAGKAIWWSLFNPDPFGLSTKFVGFSNFIYLFEDPYYLNSFKTTAVFSIWVTVLSMGLALLLAVLTDRLIKSAGVYQTLFIWPYAVAPAISGVLWMFMFDTQVGLFSWYLGLMGWKWDHLLNDTQAMAIVVVAATWSRISYNYLFFLAGLQSIPKSIIEASAIDGAKFWKRFVTIIIPLLSPVSFFLFVMNSVYAFFDTFGVIHTITKGGPEQTTMILVYKVYSDGFVGLDLGSSSAQSVVLLFIVGLLTIIQFKYIEKKVHY